MTISDLLPGDIVTVRTGNSFTDKLIRLGDALRDRPNLDNHVVIVHHVDDAHTVWGIEGRPGGVGWVDMKKYDNPYANSNTLQPKTEDQRQQICDYAKALLGTPYDWQGIYADAMNAIGAPVLWRAKAFGDMAPAHVVCSSLAGYVYDKVKLDRPMGLGHKTKAVSARFVTPGMWCKFNIEKGWEQ